MAQDYKNISDLGGLYTNAPADKIPLRNASDILNIDLSSPGLIQTKKGYDLFANEITTAGENTRSFVYKKNYGTPRKIKLRVRDDGTTGTLEWLNPYNTTTPDGKWETLVSSLTTGAIMGFTPFNNTNKNQLVFCNAVENYSTWNGATARISSVVGHTITAATIAFVDSGPDTITDSGNGFVTAGFQAGDVIVVSGAAQAGNNGTFTIDTVVAGTITLTAPATLTAEGAGATVTITAGRITKAGTETFAFESFDTTGSILIDGTEYAYTGGTATTTLTGVTPSPAALVVGAGIAQKPDTTSLSALPKGNVLLTAQARVWLAGVKDRESTMYYSEVGDATNYTIGNNPDDPGIEDFPDGGGAITLLDAKDKQAIIIHKEDGILQFTLEYTSTAKIPHLDTITLADDSGAANLKSGAGINKSAYFVSRSEGLKSLATALYTSDLSIEPITDIILPTIANYDFSEASSIYYPPKRAIYVACKSSSDISGNDRVISFYLRKNPEGQTVGDISIDTGFVADWMLEDKTLYFVSSLDQNAYKAFSRYSATGVGLNHLWTSKELTYSEPAKGKEFDIVYVEGFIKDYTKIKITVLYGNMGSEGSKTKILAWNDDYVQSGTISALGTDVLGINSLGATSEEITDSHAFSVPIHFDVKKSTRYAIKIETYYDDETNVESYWAVSNISSNPTLMTIDNNKIINSND
jgi:hypothetical protein